MWTQRTGVCPRSTPAASSSPQSSSNEATVSIGPLASRPPGSDVLGAEAGVDPLGGLRDHPPQHRLDLLELLGVAGQGRSQLDDGVAAVVGAADQPPPVELTGEEAS